MPSIPSRPAGVGRGGGDRGHVVDLDAELGRERVAQERHGAAGERAEEVRRRARGEVLAAEGGRQVGVPVEGPGRQPRSAVSSVAVTFGAERAVAGSARKRSSVSWIRVVSIVGPPSSSGPIGLGIDRTEEPVPIGTVPARNRRGRGRAPLAADTQRTRARCRRASALAEEPRDGGGARRAPGDAELQVDVREVALDRPRAEAQRGGDLLVRLPVGAQAEDVALARRQRLDRPATRRCVEVRSPVGLEEGGRPRGGTPPRPARPRGGCGSGSPTARAALRGSDRTP